MSIVAVSPQSSVSSSHLSVEGQLGGSTSFKGSLLACTVFIFMKANDFIEGLALRGLMKTAMVWLHFERVLELLPWAVVISNTYFCVHGGIGPQLMKNGLGALRKSRRPATYPLELALEQEVCPI